MFKFKNILVTGAAGFIGSNFVRMMLNKYDDINIISYDKLTYAGSLENLKNLNNGHNHLFIRGDITNAELLNKTLIENKIDTIVHFAAESHVDNSIANPQVFLETNIMGTFVLLEAARKYWLEQKQWGKNQCRFHHVSTDEVYGSLNHNEASFTEEHCYKPNSPYSASKASSDHIVRSYFHTYGLPITISNCSNNYGSYQHHEKLIPLVIKNCLEQKNIPIYGDGLNIRDWLYVEDHCSAIECILKNGAIGEIYNIGGNNEIDNLTLIKNICHIMDDYHPQAVSHEKLMTFVEDRKGHDFRYAIDNSKIQNELGWQPTKDFKTLLNKTVEFYLTLTIEGLSK